MLKHAIIIVLGLMMICGFSNAPAQKGREYYEKNGEVIWEIPVEKKMIALTFDDGPNPRSTNQILDVLKQYDAKATFFVVGNRVNQFPETIEREIEEGHEVANHTYSHIYFKKNMNPEIIKGEIIKTEQTLKRLTGNKTHLFRPPGGYYNDEMVQAALDLEYTIILWSWHHDTKDWRKPGVHNIVKNVLDNAHNGDIVLLHDNSPGSAQTVQALKVILPELTKRGFQMVTVSDLIDYKMMKTIPPQ